MAIAGGVTDAALLILPTPTALCRYTAWVHSAVPIASALATRGNTAASGPATADHGRTATNPDAAANSDTAGAGAASAAATIAAKAIGGIAKSNDTIAMHQLAIATTAAGAVSIQAGVVVHIFRRTRFAIDLNLINLHIATGGVVIVFNVDIA